jgi:hypothetical protein
MSIPHGDFCFFGDNHVGALAAMVFAIAARSRSDSGPGGALISGTKVRSFLRAGADLLASHVFGLDLDGCRALGRYAIARALARLPLSFVFTPDPPDHSVSKIRRLKTILAPSLPPEEGRGRFSFSPHIAQDEFAAPVSVGVCR